MKRQTSNPLPYPIAGIEQKQSLKLLGMTFQDDPNSWYLHIDNLLSKAVSRMYILCVCKSYGYSSDHLNKLLESLIFLIFY